MLKDYFIRARVPQVLKTRLASYIDNEQRRGRILDESSVVRDALVEFLDREEQRPPLPTRAPQLNETGAQQSVIEIAAGKALDPARHQEITGSPPRPSPLAPRPGGKPSSTAERPVVAAEARRIRERSAKKHHPK